MQRLTEMRYLFVLQITKKTKITKTHIIDLVRIFQYRYTLSNIRAHFRVLQLGFVHQYVCMYICDIFIRGCAPKYISTMKKAIN